MNDRYVITDRVIKKSVLVKSSLDQVWEKWTTHEGLKSFFGYDNNFSLEIGGPFEILMLKDAPDGWKVNCGIKYMIILTKLGMLYSDGLLILYENVELINDKRPTQF